MASKFEITLMPRVAAVIAAGAVAFTGVIFVTSRFGTGDRPPYQDYLSPDGRYAASVEHASLVNITSQRLHGKWWTVAQGDNRITGLKWLDAKNLEVLYKPGNPKGLDDPQELPRQRSRFLDVAVTYKLTNSAGK